MVQPLRRRRATRMWLTRLDRKTRDADLQFRCRLLLKVHAGHLLLASASRTEPTCRLLNPSSLASASPP